MMAIISPMLGKRNTTSILTVLTPHMLIVTSRKEMFLMMKSRRTFLRLGL